MTSCCIGAARFAACATAIPTFSFLAPLSLLPVPIDLLVSLLFGALDVTTWVNVSAVCRALRLRGYSAEPLSPPKSEGGFLRASVVMGTTLRQLTLAPHLREAMALAKADTGRGLVAGFAVACLAIVADRLMGAWARRRKEKMGLP